ncbi:MAG: exodeoxyribonuclease VII small subunit [Pseudomonadales bacterium]
MATSKKNDSFEQSLNDLENLVTQMEQGDLSLNDSLKAFEQGVKLSRDCQQILDEAEQKIQLLSERDGEFHSAELEVK